jgi:hypothetical protein
LPGQLGAVLRSAGLHRSSLRSFTGPSSFSDIGIKFAPGEIDSATWVDYDADGRLDILTLGYTDEEYTGFATRLYHNNGDGTFSEVKNTGLPGIWGRASWGDYNSDGYPDVVIAGCDSTVCTSFVTKLYRNNGDGTFTEDAAANLAGLFPFAGESSITWADYDNDGRSDILLTGLGAPTISAQGVNASLKAPLWATKLYHNNGDGSFSEVTNAGLPEIYTAMTAWSDYNADGYVDVLFNGCADLECSSYATKLYRNNGDGTFTENTQAGLADAGTGWIAWGDYDGDDFPDIVVSGYPGMLFAGASALDGPAPLTKLYHNNGDGTFTEASNTGLPGMSGTQAIWGDYNSDGLPDLLLNGCSEGCLHDTTQLYRNNGDGTFTQDTSVGLPDAFAWLAWGDYNSDGRPDLLAWQIQPGWTATIFKNENLLSGLPPNPPTGLRARLTGRRDVSFVWNASDSKTTSTAVGYNLRVGTASGIGDVVSPLANDGGSRQLVQPGNAEEKTFAKLRLLAPGTYYWSVQSIGADFAGSDFAREQKLTIPAKVSLKLSASKISLCGQAPRSVVASGKVEPAFSPAATVILKRAFGPHAGFKKFATAKTSSSGAFRVRGIGKTLKRSFWVRAMTETKLASRRLVSVSRLVSVDSSCRVAEK